ncbi:phosphatase PAP2 family protein [Endozoicomonas sp.]|uniref:phosphatase PAP2 family protein n=1 Tax=Endozoicomonas sp. TaxID=1892382 RepID=UPI003AF8BC5B
MLDSAQLIANLQAALTPFDFWLRLVSTAGYSGGYLLICIALYWSGFITLAARLACTLLASTLIFGGCRQIFDSSRPYYDHPELFNYWKEHRWGMPSGHSQNAVVFWGGSLPGIPSKLFKLLAVFFIALIALSRLYLGVHYPGQVIAGLIVGSCIVIISWRFEATFIHWLLHKRTTLQLLVLFFLSSTPCLITATGHELLGIGSGSGTPYPYQKLSFYSGLLFGASLAILIASTRTVVTRLSPSWKLISTRTLPGLLIAMMIWQFRFEPQENNEPFLIIYLVSWLQGIGISLWAGLIWPLCHYLLLGQKHQQIDQELAE